MQLVGSLKSEVDLVHILWKTFDSRLLGMFSLMTSFFPLVTLFRSKIRTPTGRCSAEKTAKHVFLRSVRFEVRRAAIRTSVQIFCFSTEFLRRLFLHACFINPTRNPALVLTLDTGYSKFLARRVLLSKTGAIFSVRRTSLRFPFRALGLKQPIQLSM